MDNLEYKGIKGIVYYDGKKGEFSAVGENPPVVLAHATTYEELSKNFRDYVDHYLSYNDEMGGSVVSNFVG